MSDNAYDMRIEKEKEIKQLLTDNHDLIHETILLKKRIKELEDRIKSYEQNTAKNHSR